MKSSQQIICFYLHSSLQLKLLEPIQSYWKVKRTITNSGISLSTTYPLGKELYHISFLCKQSEQEKNQLVHNLQDC